jgi:hypothetical protein
MKEQTAVRFLITSATLTAVEIQNRLGIVPDDSWKAGDKRGAFAAVEKFHGYALESKAPMNASFDDHVKAMLKRVAPQAQKIGAMSGEAVIELHCKVHRKVGPMLRFERDDLRWLGVMGARLDVDVFILVEPPSAKPASPPPKTGP